MLFLSDSIREQRAAIARDLVEGRITGPEAGRRFVDLDPESGISFMLLGEEQVEAGNLAEAESLFWQGLTLSPCSYTFYLALSDVRRRIDEDDRLSARLRSIAIWKLSFLEKVPDSVAQSFQGKSQQLDFSDPETYSMIATTIEIKEKDIVDPEDLTDRLLPYSLLNDLQRQAPTVVLYSVVDQIMANSDRCLPLLRAGLREWGRNGEQPAKHALCLTLALVGELAGVEALDELLEVSIFNDDQIFLHTNWAIYRIGQRFPAEALQKFREAATKASVARRCVIAEQMDLLPDVEGLSAGLLGLLDGFATFADHGDAHYLLMVVVYALGELGLEAEAKDLLTELRPTLSPAGQESLSDLLEMGDEFTTKLVHNEIDGLTIREICIDRALLPDEDEDEEVDLEDWEDGDDEKEDCEDDEPIEQVIAPVRPGRNDPCWCGSGKKYKKCHLAADEDSDRAPAEPPKTVGDPFYSATFQKLMGATADIRSRANMREATGLYFDREPADLDAGEMEEAGFFDWFLFDYHPEGTGRTVVEEYLRRNASRISARERTLLDSWRAARVGLFEVQEVRKGSGVELKDVFASDEFFVRDVTASKEMHRWDYALTRVQEFEGARIFSGNGAIVPRNMLPRLREMIEAESAAAGKTPAEFVRANSHRWYRTIKELHREQLRDLRVMNAEGDPMEFCSATYRVLDEPALIAALEATKVFEDVTNDDDAPGVRRFGWLEALEGPRRSYGHIEIGNGHLRLECNSRKRIAIGRQLLEKNAGAFLSFESEAFESLDEVKKRLGKEKPAPPKPSSKLPPEVEKAAILKVKTEHYSTWADTPLPALQGKTPRDSVRSEVGRKAVQELLRTIENSEARTYGDAAFDFAPIRKDLGLAE